MCTKVEYSHGSRRGGPEAVLGDGVGDGRAAGSGLRLGALGWRGVGRGAGGGWGGLPPGPRLPPRGLVAGEFLYRGSAVMQWGLSQHRDLVVGRP